MNFAKKLAVEALCGQIVALVTGEDDAISYPVGSVRVNVASGTKAKAEGTFRNAMLTYLRARDTKEGEKRKEAFLQAVDEYVKEMGY
jgi:hypothetical protein